MDGPSTILRGDTFEDRLASVAAVLDASKNVIVLAGAGISVSCGIPDFRSANGLYNTLNYQELGLASPEDLFDIETFRDDPRPFYKFAHSLYPGSIDPGPSHKFLAWLDNQKKLLRIYTQNIDGLEESAGARPERVVYAHGSLRDATCVKCKVKYPADDIAGDVRAGTVPLCRRPRNKKAKLLSSNNGPSNVIPKKTSSTTPPVERRRSSRRACAKRTDSYAADDDDYEASRKRGLCCGVVKPNVTFFGEKLDDDVGRSLEKDRKSADALVVMGTSLSVAPMSKVIEFLPPDVPRILINRNVVSVPKASYGEEGRPFHACLLGNCDDVVKELQRKMKNGNDNEKATDVDDIKSNCGSKNGLVSSDETWPHNQPRESVLLFPGALFSNSKETSSEPERKVVVNCDECQGQIHGKIYCCKTCFDYDLCEACYPAASSTHAEGKHGFSVEGCC